MDASGAGQAEAGAAREHATEAWQAKIIFGEPKAEDEFGGLGHERSARALADGIRQLAERTNGRTRAGGAIGLEGAWGSGKSTVIDIARRKYLGAEYPVFTFDFWRHQSDDFRRALLEQLISFVRNEFNPKGRDGNHIHKADDRRPKVELDIDRVQDDVKNRKSVTTTSSIRRVSLFGTFLLIILPLTPVLYGWLLRILASSSQPAQGGASSPTADAGWVALNDPTVWVPALLLSYLALAIAGIAAAYFFGYADKKSFQGKTAWLRGGASRLLNLSERDHNNEVTQKIRDESPTTVEFRTVFEEILVPLQKANKHVVFVLDNVDRIPSADLSKTWAEMRSLIAGNGDMANRFGAVIAVIPYDRDHVGQAFPPVRVPKLVGSEDEEGVYKIDRKEGIELETDVFEKTFDRIIKVSAPVPSDWKQFLMKRIQEAGYEGEHGPDYAEKLFRLLQYQLQREGVHPTPRRIIAYANEIGGLWVQWAGSRIPVETVGLYVLHRQLFDRDPSILSKPQPVPIRFARIVDDPEYANHLAALAFNVEPALADQVRLGVPITNGLLDPDDEESLIALSGGDGFYEIFQDVLRDRLLEWSKDSPESISLAARHVDKLQLPAESEGAIWQIFTDAVATIEKLEYGQEGLDGLYTIVSRQKRHPPETVAGIIREKFEATSLAEDDSKLLSAGMSWYRLMQSLAKAISAAAGVEGGRKFWNTSIPSNSGVFNLGVISASQSTSEFKFSDISLGCTEAELSKALLKMIEVNPVGYDFAVGVVWRRLGEHASDHFGAIASRIDSVAPDEMSIRLVHAATRFMGGRRRVSAAVKAAFEGIKDGALLTYAKWADEHGNADDLAVLLLLLVTANDGAPAAAVRGSSAPVEWFNNLLVDAVKSGDMPEYLVEKIKATYNASAWIGWAVASTSENGLYCEVLRAMTESENVWLYDQLMIAKHYDRISEIAGEDGAAFFLRQFGDHETRIARDFGGEAVTGVPSGMIAALSGLGDEAPAKQILGLIREHLSGLDADEWYEALTNPSDENGRLLVAMREHTNLELRSPDFIAGLVRVAVSALEGSFDPAPLARKWQHIFGVIPVSQYVPLRAQIVSGMRTINVSAPGSVAFVKHFSTLAQKMRFSTDMATADMVLSHFLWHLANSDDEAATRYLKSQRKEIDATLKAASSDEVRNAFLDVRRRTSEGAKDGE